MPGRKKSAVGKKIAGTRKKEWHRKPMAEKVDSLLKQLSPETVSKFRLYFEGPFGQRGHLMEILEFAIVEGGSIQAAREIALKSIENNIAQYERAKNF